MPRTTYEITMPDLTGKRAVITGASDGIGLIIAKTIAGAGAEVLMPVRNRTKGEAAVASIRERHPEAKLELHDLDVSSLESVEAFATSLCTQGAPVNLLINNAAVMTPPERQTSVDGLELQLATNHLGHFALTAHLMPLLKLGAARVTSQVSIAARSGSVHWDDPNFESSYDGMRAYQQSKIAQGLFALELGRRSQGAGWGITSTIAHPGVAPTSLLAARSELGRANDTMSRRVIRRLSALGLLVGTPESAALPALLAATSAGPEPEAFFGPQGPGKVGGRPGPQELWKPLTSLEDAARVWTLSEKLTRVKFDVYA
ncbi:SDR family oxidoreductase [Nocardioides sp.]|uniref:SDR family oxidoreductase n=1 Tax=Nocardioides sp. TaxID=35761 RepID=UPI0032192A9F